MTSTSPLHNVHKKGLYGDYESKDEKNIIKVSEVKNLQIIQIVKYKNSDISLENINIDNLNLINKPPSVIFNEDTRILWIAPNSWLLTSKNRNILKNINHMLNNKDFAITDLSHSRAIIELEGEDSKEVLKKGCPFNFNQLKPSICINSIFNGITITIDMINDSPKKIRLFVLRSFGESLHHSITDACLEFGYKNI